MGKKTETPLVSVLVITYNQEEYIRQTLESIISQQHTYSYEIVITDDCSTDKTQDIINEYTKLYPLLIKSHYNDKNLGLIRNYFSTLLRCSGKYIMQCAGDDWWLPGKVKTQIEFMEKNSDIGMCYGNARTYIQKNKQFSKKIIGEKTETFEKLLNYNGIPALSVCMKMETLKKYILEIKPLDRNWLMEDYPMWIWFSINSKIHFLNISLACYRLVENSVSHSSNLNKIWQFYNSTWEIQNFFSQKYKETAVEKKSNHRIYFSYYATQKNREMALKELNQFYSKSKKEKVLTIIYSSKILFKLYCIFY